MSAVNQMPAAAAAPIGETEIDAYQTDGVIVLRGLFADCLEARGGEVSARARAAALGRLNLGLDDAGHRLQCAKNFFLSCLQDNHLNLFI